MKTVSLTSFGVKGRCKKTTTTYAFSDFIAAVNAYFSFHNPFTIWEGFLGEPLGLALHDKLIAIQIPYDDPEDWERFRIRFMTPPHLTQKLIQGIKDGTVDKLNTD